MVNRKLFTVIRFKKIAMIRIHKPLKHERSILLKTLEATATIHFFRVLLYELVPFGFMVSFPVIVNGLLSNKRARIQ